MMLKITVCIVLILASFRVNAQVKAGQPISRQIDSTFKDSPNFDVAGFLYLDQVIIASMPTLKDYHDMKDKLNALPKDHIRYIDSIDYYISPKDILHVKIYAQNYAFKSNNAYMLEMKSGSRNDVLVLNQVFNIDFNRKPVIEDIAKYRNQQFDLTIAENKIKEHKQRHRLVVQKDYR